MLRRSQLSLMGDWQIVPARDGTLRVLRAARDAGVKRVVVTSSFAAVGYRAYLALCHLSPWLTMLCSLGLLERPLLVII